MRRTEERFARVGELDICYDEIGPEDGEPMLMIMGLATQLVHWHPEFCELLAERGFRVIRYDNRDIGRSTKLDARMPSRAAMMLGRPPAAYTLEDMSEDAAGLLDALRIESAHVVGVSMGGMIGQMLALRHPDRVRSLASIMSGPGSRWTRMPRLRALARLLKPMPGDRAGFVDRTVATFEVIGSPGFDRDSEWVREVAGEAYDRGHGAAGVARQMHAISVSPDRTAQLRGLRVPTVVIHGRDDPLALPRGGRAVAKAVPDSRLLIIDGMGHDLPKGAWPQIVDAIAENAARAKASADQAADRVTA